MIDRLKVGRTLELDFAFTQTDGSPRNITNGAIHLVLKKDADQTTYDLHKTVDEHIDAENGVSYLKLTHDDTRNLEPGYYLCEITYIDFINDIIEDIFSNKIIVEPSRIDF